MSAELSPIVAYADDPCDDTVHHPFSAYNQGHDAAHAGYPASLCPYGYGRERDWWKRGHFDASLERAEAVALFDHEETDPLELSA